MGNSPLAASLPGTGHPCVPGALPLPTSRLPSCQLEAFYADRPKLGPWCVFANPKLLKVLFYF